MSDDTKALCERLRALDKQLWMDAAPCALVPATAALVIERLERERGTLLCTGTTGKPQLTPLGQTIERLERELAETQTDARRYRWLRQPGALRRTAHIAVLTGTGGYVAESEQADAAIDAAMVENDER